MMMRLTRKILPATAQVKSGRWTSGRCGRSMPQVQTVGLVGLGRIGSAMAQKVHGLGMRVIASDPVALPGDVPDFVDRVELDELMRVSDVVWALPAYGEDGQPARRDQAQPDEAGRLSR